MTERLLRLPEVLAMTGLKRATLYRLMKIGQFPPPVRLTVRTVAWRESDVLAWIASRESCSPPRSQ